MLTITFSNRLEQLLTVLQHRMGELPQSPFIAEQIIVPSAAIRRKLELGIADQFGICSNTVFSPLRSWLLEQIIPGQNASLFATRNPDVADIPDIGRYAFYRRTSAPGNLAGQGRPGDAA